MKEMKNPSIILLLFMLFTSCCGSKVVSYLKNCDRIRVENEETYCLVSIKDLKNNIPKKDKVYYMGTDIDYHYFKYHYRTTFFSYDKTAKWAVMGFKIPITEEYHPKNSREFKLTNTCDDAYIVLVDEL